MAPQCVLQTMDGLVFACAARWNRLPVLKVRKWVIPFV